LHVKEFRRGKAEMVILRPCGYKLREVMGRQNLVKPWTHKLAQPGKAIFNARWLRGERG